MAILIEEEKKSTNWAGVTLIIVVIAVLFLGSYFIFFQKPELIEVVIPKSLESLNQLSKISFNPDEVINSSNFKLLRRYDTPRVLPTPGRSNPFKPY